MPVAKLSREFYQRFGDKLTDELVNCLNSIEASYRSELGSLFEAHFGRFEEKLERRLAETKAEIRAEFRTEIERLPLHLPSLRADMLKWNVALWVPVTLAPIGLYLNP